MRYILIIVPFLHLLLILPIYPTSPSFFLSLENSRSHQLSITDCLGWELEAPYLLQTLFFCEGIELCESNEIISSHWTFNTISLCSPLLTVCYRYGVSFFYAFISVFSLFVCMMHTSMCGLMHVLFYMRRPQEDVGFPVLLFSAIFPRARVSHLTWK